MERDLICSVYTKETGRISYYVTRNVGYGVQIEQERGILTAAYVEYFTGDYTEAVAFIKRLASGKVTGATLYSLCDDYLADRN